MLKLHERFTALKNRLFADKRHDKIAQPKKNKAEKQIERLERENRITKRKGGSYNVSNKYHFGTFRPVRPFYVNGQAIK